MGRRLLGLGVAALCVAGCATSQPPASSKAGSATDSQNSGRSSGGFGTPQAVTPGQILVAVSGDGPALITLTVDGVTQQMRETTLPWETTLPTNSGNIRLKAETQSALASAHISCSIVPSNGSAPTLENGTPGPHSTVSCIHGSGTS